MNTAKRAARSAVMNPTAFEGEAATDINKACRQAQGLALLGHTPVYVLHYGPRGTLHSTSVKPPRDVPYYEVPPIGAPTFCDNV